MVNEYEKNTPPLIDAIEGRKPVEIVTAIYQSGKT